LKLYSKNLKEITLKK